MLFRPSCRRVHWGGLDESDRAVSAMHSKGSLRRTQAKRQILIVDDHPLLRRGLTALIESEADLAVCGEAATCRAALEAIGQSQPDLVIVDLVLGEDDGLDLVKAIRARHPETPSLVLSMHDESVYAERSLRAGALGYVTKQRLDDTVLVAIRCVLNGEKYVSPGISARLDPT
jgi:DNA-binding NarL/FixJ family response regulator